jgi:hypothetical protein
MPNCEIQWGWELGEYEYVFRIRGNAVPYKPASMYGGADRLGWPAEGGYVDDWKITLLKRIDGDGTTITAIPNSEEVVNIFAQEIEDNPVLCEQIETALGEDYDARHERED